MKRRRQKFDPPWTPFEDVTAFQTDDFLNACGCDRVWINSRYQVLEETVRTRGEPSIEITYLSIKRRDRKVIRDWRELQRIKNELCGPEREACELFPAESRLVDTSNQFHLWVLPEGESFPFGFMERLVMDANIRDDLLAPSAEQRPFDDDNRPADIVDTQEEYDRRLEEAIGDTSPDEKSARDRLVMLRKARSQ